MRKTVPDNPTPAPITVETQERLLQVVMRRQGALSLRVGALFLLPLLALPLLNQNQPEFMNRQFLGFSLTWLILGICIFPLTWLVSAYFVRKSDAIEAECTLLGREMLPDPDRKNATASAVQEEGTV